jgi:hypothetical protein
MPAFYKVEAMGPRGPLKIGPVTKMLKHFQNLKGYLKLQTKFNRKSIS